MGIVEKEAKRKRVKGYIQNAIFATVATAGILLVAMAAPNTLQLLGKVPGMRRSRFNAQARTALGRLAQKGWIVFERRDGKHLARITETGKRAFAFEAQKTGLYPRRRWDKRWRIVMFDVPERRRAVRDKLRMTMKSFGFVRLQDSAWVYPYDCEDLIALLKAELKIGFSALYLVVEHIENDKYLREEFGFKS
ncbi:CRISPR-associated endonuclease Cas2 [Candidatus Kaiserbacteria bacterium RIFCSPLOWO2_01_FULL_54_20]|uniref:CRISPR-associated endonuclease Cas2 n=1 Tax=Candidatus Kaiserbacteria bacterium RIFCSPLOWO2_01_FULL_54_20 TaxID=1798513 RepID=A0A1F6EK26_9BACT|nr:MAG: CRISPR-associated endonuclease Cas2 [Candidatus Kaiserbacteria bacterium RIFCSPLOWO2_01_FULL_54_20]